MSITQRVGPVPILDPNYRPCCSWLIAIPKPQAPEIQTSIPGEATTGTGRLKGESLAQGPTGLGWMAPKGGLVYLPVRGFLVRPHAKPQMLTWLGLWLALLKVNIMIADGVVRSVGSSSLWCFFLLNTEKPIHHLGGLVWMALQNPWSDCYLLTKTHSWLNFLPNFISNSHLGIFLVTFPLQGVLPC